jgi:hypothetical protein
VRVIRFVPRSLKHQQTSLPSPSDSIELTEVLRPNRLLSDWAERSTGVLCSVGIAPPTAHARQPKDGCVCPEGTG